MRIWKERLKITDEQKILVPKDAKILTVQEQRERLQIWFLCDETKPKELRRIAIYGTRNPMPNEPGEYIGTVQMNQGTSVWHVFNVAHKN